MRPRDASLAGAGLVAGAAVVGVVGGLLQRVLQPAGEIRRYVDDTREASDAIAANLRPTDELRRTAATATHLAELVREAPR